MEYKFLLGYIFIIKQKIAIAADAALAAAAAAAPKSLLSQKSDFQKIKIDVGSSSFQMLWVFLGFLNNITSQTEYLKSSLHL